MKRISIDFSPFKKYPDYRWLYAGQFISFFGSMITYVAIPYQMYHLTKSSTMVGSIGIIQLLTLIIFGTLGGTWADIYNRKKLMIGASLVGACGNLGLIIFSYTDSHSTALLIFLAALMSMAKALERPSLEAITQQIIAKEDFALISPLGTLKSNAGFIVGPAVGGILIASVGIISTYFIDLLTFIISIFCVLKVKFDTRPSSKVPSKKIREHFYSIKEGLSYAWKNPVLMGSYVVDILSMTFAFPTTLFPALAYGVANQSLLGWYYSSPAIGGLVAVLFSGWTYRVIHHGKSITWCAALWCLGILGFAFTFGSIWGFIFLALAGLFDSYSGVFRSTLWNELIDSHFRGRLAAVEMISYTCGPLIGGSLMGIMADQLGKKTALGMGGAMGVVVVFVVGIKIKSFWNYRSIHQNSVS
ncbi:MAG: MFS transporter [Bacteriovoracaceae bacterium]|nr:MFS transporter [Bacteriovoracaceae bacterium]